MGMQQFYAITKTKRVLKEPENGKKTKMVSVKTPILSPEHIPVILDFFKDLRILLIIRILLGSGIRFEELSQISRETFYPDNRTVLIESQKKACVNPARYCYLSKDACKAVREWIEGDYTLMSRVGFYQHMKIFESVTGIKITSKTFRKTHEIWRLDTGHEFYKVGSDMGHTSRVLMTNYYSPIPWNEEQILKIKELVS